MRGCEIEDGDGRADDGDVASSDRTIAVRVPNGKEGEKGTEERREQGEQQKDQPDHNQVGEIVGGAQDPDLSPSRPVGDAAAVGIEISPT